jgi:hypothetical protein
VCGCTLEEKKVVVEDDVGLGGWRFFGTEWQEEIRHWEVVENDTAPNCATSFSRKERKKRREGAYIKVNHFSLSRRGVLGWPGLLYIHPLGVRLGETLIFIYIYSFNISIKRWERGGKTNGRSDTHKRRL